MTLKAIFLLEYPRLATNDVASILEHYVDITIQYWLGLVEHDEELTCIYLSSQDRIRHLPQLFRDLINRLRLPAEKTTSFSIAAHEHGAMRRHQGYTAAMLVEEWRILEVSIFTTIHNNLRGLDPSTVLRDVTIIADVCDSQLKQAMLSYVEFTSSLSAA
jgi:nitric oxide reductase activation protein